MVSTILQPGLLQVLLYPLCKPSSVDTGLDEYGNSIATPDPAKDGTRPIAEGECVFLCWKLSDEASTDQKFSQGTPTLAMWCWCPGGCCDTYDLFSPQVVSYSSIIVTLKVSDNRGKDPLEPAFQEKTSKPLFRALP